jgi:hypothetical protein
MATLTAVEPDTVIEFELEPGTYRAFRDALAEGGPRMKCFKGSVTLVSPRLRHESGGHRLNLLIVAVCQEFKVPYKGLASTTWDEPTWKDDTGYEADESYYIQSFGTTKEGHRPDLAVEVLNAGRDTKARRCGEALEIPEMWVYDVRRRRLTFLGLTRQGKNKKTYKPITRSRALPWLLVDEVAERLADPEEDDGAFQENCRRWARKVLKPRQRSAGNGG